MISLSKIIIAIYIGFMGMNIFAQNHSLRPDLSKNGILSVVNREATLTSRNDKPVVHLDGRPGDGVAWVNHADFSNGIIEADIKGKNVMQQSFVGIAFHGADDSTFDAIYFRPFNFQSPDVSRKKHSVQYISMPTYDWSILRNNYPGKYENGLTDAIDPESWFHAKIVVTIDEITMYVNDNPNPALVVKPLNDRASGKIGFWVGNNSDGDFSNLVITYIGK